MMKFLTSLLSLFPFSWIGVQLFGQTPTINVPFSVDFPFKEGSISSVWKSVVISDGSKNGRVSRQGNGCKRRSVEVKAADQLTGEVLCIGSAAAVACNQDLSAITVGLNALDTDPVQVGYQIAVCQHCLVDAKRFIEMAKESASIVLPHRCCYRIGHRVSVLVLFADQHLHFGVLPAQCHR